MSRRQLLAATAGAAALGAVGGALTGDATGHDSAVASVRDSRFDGGASGDGLADDTAAINSAIRDSRSGAVYFPDGTYLVTADRSSGIAIDLSRAGARITLAPRAVIRLAPNDLEVYAMVHVGAPDCVIEGGRWIGDVDHHFGSTGEWGHCIHIGPGADRCIVRNTTVTRAWGDGVFVNGHVADISVENIVATENRRQGMSITDALRPRVIGGRYALTGTVRFTAPGAGIDIEPDAGVGTVIDATVTNVLVDGNVGAGFVAASNGQQLSCRLVGCTSRGNGHDGGYWILGAGGAVSLIGCSAVDNAGTGFTVNGDSSGADLTDCSATGCGAHGFIIDGPRTLLTACDATHNAHTGYYIGPGGAMATLTACTATGNAYSSYGFPQIDVRAPAVRMTNVVSDAGSGAAHATYGYAIRPEAAGAGLISCSAVGEFAIGPWIDLAHSTVAIPVPGAEPVVLRGSRRGESAAAAATRQALAASGLVDDRTVP